MPETTQPPHDHEVTSNGNKFSFQPQKDGTYYITAENYELMGLTHKARAAAELSKQLGEAIKFRHNGALASIDSSSGTVVCESEAKWLQELLDETFDSNREAKIRQYVSEWIKKEDVQDKFYQIIQELKKVEESGQYNNLFESPTVAEAIVEAVNSRKEIHSIDDPLSEASKLIFELTSDLQEPWDGDGAGFDDYTAALTFVTHEAYRQFRDRHRLN